MDQLGMADNNPTQSLAMRLFRHGDQNLNEALRNLVSGPKRSSIALKNDFLKEYLNPSEEDDQEDEQGIEMKSFISEVQEEKASAVPLSKLSGRKVSQSKDEKHNKKRKQPPVILATESNKD